MFWRQKRSRSKRALSIILLFLSLCIVSTAGLSYFITTDHLEAEVEQTNMSLLHEVNSKLLLVLKAVDAEAMQFLRSRDMRMFMEDDAADQQDTININTRIGDMLLSNDTIFSIDLYSYAKKRWSQTNPFQTAEPGLDYQWINAFERYKGFYQWVGTRKLSLDEAGNIRQNVMTLIRSYPLTHGDGYRKGAVAFNVDERSIYNLIGNAIDPSFGYLFLADAEGTILSHGDKSMIGAKASEFLWSKEMKMRDEGTFRTKVNGFNRTVFYMKSPYTGWEIISVVSDAELSKPLVQVRNTLFGISILLLLLAGGMSVVLNSWMFRPVNRVLTNVTKQLQAYGRYERQDEYSAEDEFSGIEVSLSYILADSNRLYKQMRETQPVIKWRLVMDALIGARQNPAELLPNLEAIGYPLHALQFIVMVAEFDRKSVIATPQDLQLYSYALCNVAEEMINTEYRGVAIEARDGMVVIVISFDEADGEANLLRTLAVAELIKSYVEEKFKQTISLGLGRMMQEIGMLQQSYHDAISALSYKMILGGNAIISSEDIREPASGEFMRLLGLTDGIVDSLRLTDSEKMTKQTERWFGEMAGSGAAPDMIRQLVVHFMMKAAKVVGEIDPALLEEAPSHRLFDLLSQYESIHELSDYVIEQLARYAMQIEERRSNRERNDVVERITAFIDIHYMHSDLSLNYLASEFKLSASHVSRIFKEHTERNFIDYLMDIRMRKAKELLADTEMLIRDVSGAVGYTNVNSFVRIFKKSTGFTPGEYREREQALLRGAEGAVKTADSTK
ncbi:helix-turn-helix domain-containing protein [Paenibacillus sp. HWE-109]|uniref:helix-turn-helix domain-containing protein n=1 Tax=Paenibacillus sp. HWE-109 TaxID=1306526 RepID=UPI001EE11A1E|nr:helix-turn-helix domain-containing protein [Paenibacillus sp. HWE-109]UKS27034.1 helix-turn-helix domain-containing protein [Paenibacillus sp. HWE-109]